MGSACPPLAPELHLPQRVRDILLKARSSWLKNTEVCDLLLNYATYGLPVGKDPPYQPPGGSLFLFDRRFVRFFRKDGHVWRKKPDGKTVRETHEKLKVGNADMLNCYYAHADQDEYQQAGVRLQRRCYWLLESVHDIVLVHYMSIDKTKGKAAVDPFEVERQQVQQRMYSHPPQLQRPPLLHKGVPLLPSPTGPLRAGNETNGMLGLEQGLQPGWDAMAPGGPPTGPPGHLRQDNWPVGLPMPTTVPPRNTVV